MAESRKAFIFSLDAFVAFTLALVAVYALIFFSSMPSAYYSVLTQAHYLAKDTLTSVSLDNCNDNIPSCGENISSLEYIVYNTNPNPGSRDRAVQTIIGSRIPEEYGYSFEILDNDSVEWGYNSSESGDTHKDSSQRVKAASYTIVLNTIEQMTMEDNPYSYRTCGGPEVVCAIPKTTAAIDTPEVKVVRLTVFT